MLRLLGPVAALLFSIAILQMGNGLQGALLPIRAQLEGFATLSIGLLAACYFLGFTAGCFLGPRLVQQVGHIRAYTAMMAVASAAVLTHALFVAAAPWWLMRAVMGFCFAVLYLVIESWLNERATNATRGAVLSAYLIINLTVIALGQFLILLYDPAGFELFLLAALLISVAAVPVALTLSPAPMAPRSVHVDVRGLYRVSPAGAVACVAVGLSNGAFWGMSPVFAGGEDPDVTAVAVFMSVTVLGGAAGQWPLGKLSDAMDRRRVMVGAGLIAALAGIVLSYMPRDGLGLLAVCGALWGAVSFPLYSLAVAHANDCTSPEQFVEVASGLLLLFGLGAVTGPFLAANVMAFAGGQALYLFTSCVHLLLVGFLLNRMRARGADEIPEHTPFTEALEAAQTVSDVFKSQIQAQHAGE